MISDEHADCLVWSRGDSGDTQDQDSNIDDEDSDRLFEYVVGKSNEQEDGVTTRPGFEVRNTAKHYIYSNMVSQVHVSNLVSSHTSANADANTQDLRLIGGEM